MKNLELKIKNIEERNKKVKLNKRCETSWTRKRCIIILTYAIVVIYSYLIKNVSNIFLNSLAPILGYILSTLSLNFIRQIWENNIRY